ncbi:MAG: ABC transporter substrate-binding protein [Deltaproteobacteria bacterium]|mgnify:CR=1 FL=1|nr:ABC transporter substrate-binding protein [Deltaproteobacteria bacterium]
MPLHFLDTKPARLRSILRQSLLAMAFLATAFAVFPAMAAAPRKKARKPRTPVTAPVAAPAAPSDVVIDPTVPAPTNASAMDVLKKSHERLQKLLMKKSPKWSPESDAKNSEIRLLVGEFLDFSELAKRSLAKNWDTIKPAQRVEFVATLRDIVEKSYVGNMHSSPKYKLVWEKESRKPAEAEVFATLHTQRKGKPLDMSIEYRVLHKARGWVVYDVITDEQSLLETYRAEFAKIIKKESFDVLLTKMKSKIKKAS